MKKISVLLVLLICTVGCMKEEIPKKVQNDFFEEKLRTASKDQIAYFFEKIEQTATKGSLQLELFPEKMRLEPIRNSEEFMTVIPAQTRNPNIHSRILLYNWKGDPKEIVFHMIPKNNLLKPFSGKIIITNLEGNFLNGYRLQNGQFISQFVRNKTGKKCSSSGEDVDCGELDEVIIDAPSGKLDDEEDSPNFDDGKDSGGGGYEEPEEPTWDYDQMPPGGGSSTDDQEDEETSDKPCAGDPVKDPQLAPQLKSSGLKGALHGCTRYGGGCTGGEEGRNKPHNGIDIKNEYGDPIYAMYDGVVHSAYEDPNTGYVTRLQSVVNGETIIYQYFHMQKERLTTKGTVVKAGDLIGRQGDSGNLRRAIQDGYAVSHVHIKVSKYTGIGDSDYYKNYRSTNPVEFLGTSFNEKGEPIANNCN